jgi:hypothetical protein
VVFANITTGRPFWRGQLPKNHLIPVGQRTASRTVAGTLSATYRAMMRELEIPLEMQRTRMRHSDIKTTLSYGGKTPAEHGRKSSDKVVEMLREKAETAILDVGP